MDKINQNKKTRSQESIDPLPGGACTKEGKGTKGSAREATASARGTAWSDPARIFKEVEG